MFRAEGTAGAKVWKLAGLEGQRESQVVGKKMGVMFSRVWGPWKEVGII